MKKKAFYTEPAPVLDPTIPCLGRDKPYTGTEAEFQKSSAAVVAAYRLDCAYHCPNETRGKASKPGHSKTGADINRMMLAGQGVRPGVSDWCIPHPTAFGHPGAYIELKAKKGTLSHDQIRFLNRIKALGYYAAAIWNLDEFETVVKTLWPRRALKFEPGSVRYSEFSRDPVTVAEIDKLVSETRFSSAGDTPLFPEQKTLPFYPEPETGSVFEALKHKFPSGTHQGDHIRQIEVIVNATTHIVDALKRSDGEGVRLILLDIDEVLTLMKKPVLKLKTGGITSAKFCHGLPSDRKVIEIRGEFIHSNGAELNGPLLAKAIGMAADWEGTYENDLKLLQEQNPGLVITIDTGEPNPHQDPESMIIDQTKPVTVIDFADPGHVAIAKTLTSSSTVRVLNNPFVVGQEVPTEFDEMYADYDYATVPFWLDAVDLLVYGHRGNPIPDKEVCDKFTHQYLTHLRLRP